MICQVAPHLVQNLELRTYLKRRTPMMGHLCNIPDTYWRNIPGTQIGNATHYIEPDVMGKTFANASANIDEAYKIGLKEGNKQTKKAFQNWPEEHGTLWWRVDQFSKLAAEAGKKALAAHQEIKKDERTNDEHPYNQGIYNMTVMMGLMGHYVGDAAMPYHGTFNYDGWENGRGGIHSYYEETIVATYPPDLQQKVFKQARSLKAEYNKSKSTIENMRMLSIFSYADLPKVEKADAILSPSKVEEIKGLKIKTAAKRPPPEEAAKKFENLIVNEMAHSAKLLALLWDQAYEAAGKPNLNDYRSYKFPHTVEFIAPDYLPKR